MLLGIDLPPELLAEVLRLATDGLEVIEVVGRDAFELLADAAHGELRKPVLTAGVIEMALKEAHELATLRLAGLGLFGSGRRDEVADSLHTLIVAKKALVSGAERNPPQTRTF